jgi:hypothetical protein
MAPQTVEKARDDFRARRIPDGYSGPRHLATTIALSLLVAVASILMLEDVRLLEWLTVPLTFLYANLSEYLGHRGPMHHSTRFLNAVFVRHTIEHHAFFTDEVPSFDTTRDYRAVLFPPVLVIFFLAAFALPLGALLYFVASPNVCFLFVATAILYFLNYELLHFSYHCKPDSTAGRLPFVGRLRKHHIAHHNKQLMSHYNFNITYPICDLAFRTLYRDQ